MAKKPWKIALHSTSLASQDEQALFCEKRDECDLELSKLNEVCFFFSANKYFKAWQQKEKVKNTRWRTRNRRVERRICHKSFANFNAWKASFPSNFVLGGLPNSKWFSCKSDENSTCSWEMRPRVLSFQGIKEKKFSWPEPTLPSFKRSQESLPDEFCGGFLSALSQVSKLKAKLLLTVKAIVNQRNQHLGVHPYCCHLLVHKQCL